MFGVLGSLIISSREKSLIPILGGDINCRFGDLNQAFHEQKMCYSGNVDINTNSNGLIYGVDMCNSSLIFPINHLKIGNTTFPGDYTYQKAEKKSQIDFVFTDCAGLKCIIDFIIPNENWHLSDHRPVCLEIKANESIDCSLLLRRAKDLNYVFDPNHTKPVRYLANYNHKVFERWLKSDFPAIEKAVMAELGKENLNGALFQIEDHVAKIYRTSKIKKNTVGTNNNAMEKANVDFNNLKKCMNGEVVGDLDELLESYKVSRKLLSTEIFSREQNKWNNVLKDGDCKKKWEKIDWKGNTNTKSTHSPIFEELTNHFEGLYKAEDDELSKIEELSTDTHIPSLDKPIEKEELEEAMKDMKNGGYDHRIDIFKIIVGVLSPIILMLLNIMFYIAYPAKLTISLLNAIPKKCGFRGIQMLAALGVLYDRIINNRMKNWLTVHDVQSGFQKFKSTLHQIFTIRLLIVLAKLYDTPLYIGMFDLEKAFDKVSRFKMLQKLVKMGIGYCMLQALKRLYKFTYCILCYGNEFSRKFRTFTGIRQGAASSALLFIGFIDDLVDYLEQRCPPEPLLETLHCLLHADDTAILSTNRDLFVSKCNHMLDYFTENSLSLNLSKSGYLIINGKHDDVKEGLILKNGILEYKTVLTYLGVKISDSGCLKIDIEKYLLGKRSNVTIKYGNFCRKNFLAPLDVKIDVLNTCVSASITYACETWGDSWPKSVETIFRDGLRTSLSIRGSTNNEIVYIESGQRPLEIRIKKQQLKFWISIKEIMANKPDHYISKLVKLGEDAPYIKYYNKLLDTFTSPTSCAAILLNNFETKFQSKIRDAAMSDEDSKLGTYLTINPDLSKPTFHGTPEFQRVMLTRYRTGSHNLRIEKDRMIPGSNREDRLCVCGTGIQTIKHVLLECPMLTDVRQKYGVVDVKNGVMNGCFLLEMECVLGICR